MKHRSKMRHMVATWSCGHHGAKKDMYAHSEKSEYSATCHTPVTFY